MYVRREKELKNDKFQLKLWIYFIESVFLKLKIYFWYFIMNEKGLFIIYWC